jgi:hypothetical protein
LAINQCLFCGGTDLTREHLWPDWIVELFRRKYRGGYSAHLLRASGTVNRWRQPTITARKRLMCAECNNHTLGDVERVAKPILEPLISSAATAALDIEERAVLTGWFLARSMIWESMEHSPKGNYYTQLERELFATSDPLELPENLLVWIAGYSDGQHRAAFTIANYVVSDNDSTHVTTAVINQVVFQLVTWKGDGWSVNLRGLERAGWNEATRLLWPITSHGPIRWPLSANLNRQGLKALSQRFRAGARRPQGLLP